MRTITIGLNANDLKNLSKQINDLGKTLQSQCQTFVDRLAQVGISVAVQNTGKYAGRITFTQSQGSVSNGAKAIMIGMGQPILELWQTKDGIHMETIDSLLMAEFGSGFRANSMWATNVPNTGQGSLNVYGHAFDDGGWSWQDMNGHWHHSKGEQPSYPMYYAYVRMKQQIESIAREVFKQ